MLFACDLYRAYADVQGVPIVVDRLGDDFAGENASREKNKVSWFKEKVEFLKIYRVYRQFR